MKSVETVRIDLQYSRAGAMAVLAMAAATAAIVAFTPWRPPLAAALMAWIGAAAAEALQRVALLRGPRAVRRLSVQRNGAIEVETASGARIAGRLRPGSFVAPWLVVVRWRASGARRDATLLVLPGMAAAEPLRRLRVLLRWA